VARILFVEDDPLIRHSIARLLTSADHEVQAEATAEAGLVTAATFKFDLAILDVGLPKQTGLQCAAALRHGKFIGPIIFLTADDKPATIEAAIALDAYTYVVKPISGAQLLPLIRTALAASDASLKRQDEMVGALNDSRAISAATGVLAERNGWTIDVAFQAIRAMARSKSRKITELASEILENQSKGTDTPNQR